MRNFQETDPGWEGTDKATGSLAITTHTGCWGCGEARVARLERFSERPRRESASEQEIALRQRQYLGRLTGEQHPIGPYLVGLRVHFDVG